MYLVDTNVISELSKPVSNEQVLQWFSVTPVEHIYISSVTLCEIELGLSLMPAGKRRDALRVAIDDVVQRDFVARCLSLDATCAPLYGRLFAAQQRAGHTASTEDAMIAAIAMANEFALVTRNTKDFESIAGLRLVNPWLTPV
jgi:toxin FitB